MSNVIEFTGHTTLDLDPNKIIKYADDLTEAIVVGIDKDGELYVAGSKGDVASVVYLLAKAYKYMMEWEK